MHQTVHIVCQKGSYINIHNGLLIRYGWQIIKYQQ